VQGLLAKDEFGLRIGQVLAARTHTELAALTADIPAGLTAVRPLSEPARKPAGKKAVKAWAGVAAAFTGTVTVIAAANGGVRPARAWPSAAARAPWAGRPDAGWVPALPPGAQRAVSSQQAWRERAT
jgi:hypothetical protein